MVLVRDVREADLAALVAIYDEQVLHGISTFATDPPGIEHWRPRLALTRPGDLLRVAERDGAVVGYAFSGDYRPRGAYGGTREVSVYVGPDARGTGVGRALYADLLPRLRADGMHLVVAVIAVPNPGSRALHAAHGFEHVGTLHEVGRKFDRWIDTELWELRL